MSIPIFCMNLERATERKDFIRKEWIEKLGFDINFWKAYDRRDIAENKFIYPYCKEKAKKVRRELSEGEIACCTTHCMLYEYLLSNNYDEAIIMEDDIIPLIKDKSELFDKIEQGKIEFPQAELMILHSSKWPLSQPKILEKEIFSLRLKNPLGNQLIYVNKNYMLKLLNILKEMIVPTDWPHLFLSKYKKIIVVNEPLCVHDWDGFGASTYIGNELRNTNGHFIE